MTISLSILIERWGTEGLCLSHRWSELFSSPETKANNFDFKQLEDRTLFSGTPLADMALDIDPDAIGALDAGVDMSSPSAEYDEVSSWPVLAADLRQIDGPMPTDNGSGGPVQGTDANERLMGTDVHGGYGNDIVLGTSGNDVLDGGHGEDHLEGGAGDDVLISRSDGREPRLGQPYSRSGDPDGEINLRTRTVYSDQPIKGDDVLIGGEGADTFRFEVLINAKRNIILKHVNDDGTIDWGMKGVAGENNELHDHWVDRIGNDVIWDFDRAEGDKIEFAGHTVDVYKVEHIDTDGNGILDASVLHVQSNQGNGGGAHNKDQLGRVYVFGDLVMRSDYTVDAMVNYGIVDTIDDLREAITPRIGIPLDGSLPMTPGGDGGQLPRGAVLGIDGTIDLSGEKGDHIEVPHDRAMQLREGTISLSFTADEVNDRHAIFSKDADGYRTGGHLTAFVNDGRLEIRLQSDDYSAWIKTPMGSIKAGQEYHLAVTFGPDGFWAFVDGRMAGWRTDFSQDLMRNVEDLAIGANTWSRTAENPDKAYDYFDGQIKDFTIFDSQYDFKEIARLAGNPFDEPPTVPTVVNGVLLGTDADETLTARRVHGGYGDDLVQGTSGDDRLDGGHGEDRLEGGDGDDVLLSRSDGREPTIAQPYSRVRDPDEEINLSTRTVYPDQPIEADDVMVGGDGADTFRFEVLINAKRDIILKHVNDDGTINWGMNGVAGENNEIHDHWVDRLGVEVIEDFSRAEGDKIEVAGHTVDVYRLEHIDTDGDGILDASVLHVQSNQGNGGGAHNKDKLGKIYVFGDLVMRSDYTVDAMVNYGIVDTVLELDEAITPRIGTPVDGSMPPLPTVDDGTPVPGAVFGLKGPVDFSGEEDHIEVAHDRSLQLRQGTVDLTFKADEVNERQALFSKDAYDYQNGGHLTAFVHDGRIEVRLQSTSDSVWLKTDSGSIRAGREYQLTVTFGDDGVWLYLDGEMKDWDLDFKQGLNTNTESMAIGGNTWSRTGDHPDKTYDFFDGQIKDLAIYNSQYDYKQVATLAGVTLPAPPTAPTVIDNVLQGTDADETLTARRVHGGYGDDLVQGTSGDDRLDGGHGEDRLEGGDGDDVLLSRSDGREPKFAQSYNRTRDPDEEINLSTRTVYPDQPIEADDVMVGGDGADTFRFEVLINAKRDIILKHVNDDGTINWGMNGVAGENNEIHDHWVDRLGVEVIEDFSRAEGDKIEVAGHTVDVYRLEHIDTDGDGILDASVLHVQSNQGNGGGAHNKDKLGKIYVFGDLVMRSDYTVDAMVNYGIVDTVLELDEAITPRIGTPVDGSMPPLPTVDDGTPVPGAVFGLKGPVDFSGEEDHIEVAHDRSLQLRQGTVDLTFKADEVDQRQALFSKDASGYQNGGHLTAFVHDGRIEVRLQSTSDSVWLKTDSGSIRAGREYQLTVTFGDDGVWLYLDGEMKDWDLDFKQGLNTNTESMAIGGSAWSRTSDHPDKTYDFFDGQIKDLAIYNSQYDYKQVATLAGVTLPAPPTTPTVIDNVLQGTDADETLTARRVHGGYGDDLVQGTSGDDRLDGGHGEDRLEGGDGDDVLLSRSDGREPKFAQSYNRTRDPDEEINLSTRTVYPDQPIEADDVMVGGDGADTFRFEVLINAKRDIILKHVNDDGTINWGMNGVAGENNEIHDHWVDRLGVEVIEDFSRAEGDKIEVAGHTVDVYRLEHIDTDGDGILDASVLHVQSNQGNGGGAHNKDKLGKIYVFGDLVMRSDYTVDAMVNYGIVDTVLELDEAITPRIGTPVDGSMPPLPTVDDGTPVPGAVFGLKGPVDFSGEEDHIEVAHDRSLQLRQGTVDLTFKADEVNERQALFSKDAYDYQNGGHLTAFVHDGRIEVRLQSTSDSVWLKTDSGSIRAGREYQLTVTFGDDGVWLYLDGEMKDWDLDFKQGLNTNTESMAIGGNTWSRTGDHPDKTYDFFDGQIKDLAIYNSQYDYKQVATLAGVTLPAPPTTPTVIDNVLQGTDADETLTARRVHGGYGDDLVQGTSGDDRLDGGHGEDRLEGGDGDDVLLSRSDGREPKFAQSYNRTRDPDEEINLSTRTVYPDQPIEADDVMVGGDGADTFRFEVLINAKRDIILKHVNDDGTINWGMNGVAGENNEIHDHWVDRLGVEVIEDFSRAEGDKIEVAGHTVDVYRLEHIDTDGDGILDASVLHVQSNQGNGGGAHNKDKLGKIYVFGDLVMRSDYTVDAMVNYGIVDTVLELDEAITPRIGTPVDGSMPPLPTVDDGQAPPDSVLGINGSIGLSGDDGDFIEVDHHAGLELTEGTISLSFIADEVQDRHALFSKDAYGYKDGGHLSAFVNDGRLEVRFQSTDTSIWLTTPSGSIAAGQEYYLAVTFGGDGFRLYLNGQSVATNAGFTQGLGDNAENLAIGANTWSRTDDRPDKVYDLFDGQIEDFMIFDTQYDANEIMGLASA